MTWVPSCVAVVWAGSYSPNLTPSLGTSICRRSGSRKGKKTKKKKKKKKFYGSVVDLQCCDHFCCATKWSSYTCAHIHSLSDSFFDLRFFHFLFSAAPKAYEKSQVRSPIRATASSLHHSHSNSGPKPRLRPTPQLTAVPDPQPAEQGQGSNLTGTSQICSTTPQWELLICIFLITTDIGHFFHVLHQFFLFFFF